VVKKNWGGWEQVCNSRNSRDEFAMKDPAG
jgi:hypothetical protein